MGKGFSQYLVHGYPCAVYLALTVGSQRSINTSAVSFAGFPLQRSAALGFKAADQPGNGALAEPDHRFQLLELQLLLRSLGEKEQQIEFLQGQLIILLQPRFKFIRYIHLYMSQRQPAGNQLILQVILHLQNPLPVYAGT
ncbi:hypothetical protein D3C75_809660 [compost metagenome]